MIHGMLEKHIAHATILLYGPLEPCAQSSDWSPAINHSRVTKSTLLGAMTDDSLCIRGNITTVKIINRFITHVHFLPDPYLPLSRSVD